MTRLRFRKNDSLRGMRSAIRSLPFPDKVAAEDVFPYGDFYQSIVFDVLYRRQKRFGGDFVYHYTTQDVFGKLIDEDADLLMTRFDELNDDSELEYGWQKVVCLLEWSCMMPKIKSKLFDCEKVRMCGASEWIPWIMSFSEVPDSLFQWGMYTDRNHGGCSIAFDFREMNYTVERIRNNRGGLFDVCFLPCLYNQQEVDRAWKLWCTRHAVELDMIKNFTYNELKEEQGNLIASLMPDLLMLAAIIKHPGFEAEHEWRLMVRPKPILHESSNPAPIILNGKHRYGFNMCFGSNKLRYTMKWIRGVGASPHPSATQIDRFWEMFDDFCIAGRKQWETGAWLSEIPYNGK